jgi:hypothetical protein
LITVIDEVTVNQHLRKTFRSIVWTCAASAAEPSNGQDNMESDFLAMLQWPRLGWLYDAGWHAQKALGVF